MTNAHRALAVALATLIHAGCADPSQQPFASYRGGKDPAELISELMTADPAPTVLDLRAPEAFAAFHLPGARNVPADALDAPENAALLAGPSVVLCGDEKQARPARDRLRARGYEHVESVDWSVEEIRDAWLDKPPGFIAPTNNLHHRFAMQRAFLLGPQPARDGAFATDPDALGAPTMVSVGWLAAHLDEVVVLDVRSVSRARAFHVPGATWLPLRGLRAPTDGDEHAPLRERDELAEQVGAAGISAEDAVIVVYDDRLFDATFAAAALQKLGHRRVAILEGGMLAWASARLPLATGKFAPARVTYTATDAATFVMTTDEVAAAVRDASMPVLDARPARTFEQHGHIPGAINHPFTLDVVRTPHGVWLRPADVVREGYAAHALAADAPVVVTGLDGHMASQTWFVLRHLLGHRNARWHDGSWAAWSRRTDLPVARGKQG